MGNVGPRSVRGWPEREVRPGCRDPEVRRFALVTESTAGGWGRLGRLGRGVCPPGLGLRGAVLAKAPPLPAPPPWAPNFVLRWVLYPGRSRQFWGGGCFGSCVYPDQEEEGAVTFSDCGQGTAAASLGGSGDVRRRWRGKLPLDALSRPELSPFPSLCLLAMQALLSLLGQK